MYLGEYIPNNREAFTTKVNNIAVDLGIDPNWLMAVMYFESRLNPQAVNPISGATGLIQFMPNTAKNLGTSIEALKGMSNIEQLNYVHKYFLPFKHKLKTLGDTYLAVFYPNLIGKPETTVLPAKVQEQNPVFKPYWVNGLLQKQSIVNYFIDFFKKRKLPGIVAGVSLTVIILIIAFILIVR